MLSVDSGFYLHIPEESKDRILRPAKILGMVDGICTAKLEEEGIQIRDETDVFIYYEIERVFTQQAAHVTAVDNEDLCPVIEFRTTGEPVSVEGRQAFRVSAAATDLTAKLGDQNDCQLLDVSCSGFSVVASAGHSIAKVLDVTLWNEGRAYSGKAVVQSIRELAPGRIRYGLHCAEGRAAQPELLEALRILTLALQREQLRRMAGTK